MSTALLIARLMLAAVFAIAAIAKLTDVPAARRSLGDFGIPERFTNVGARALPLAELTVAVALVPPPTARWAGLGALILLALFSLAIARAVATGAQPDCNCFGQLHAGPVGGGALARNLGFAAVAGAIFLAGPGDSPAEALEGLSGAELALAGAAAVLIAALAVQAWFSWQLFRQQGRLLARVRALEQRVAAPDPESAPLVDSPASSSDASPLTGVVAGEGRRERAGDEPPRQAN